MNAYGTIASRVSVCATDLPVDPGALAHATSDSFCLGSPGVRHGPPLRGDPWLPPWLDGAPVADAAQDLRSDAASALRLPRALRLGLRPSMAHRTNKFDDPNMPGEMQVTISLRKVSCGTEINIVQEGLPSAIPIEFCYLGWQESLLLLTHLVEPEIPDGT